MNAEELQQQLQHFTGTEHYYRYGRRLLLTDGTKFLAETAGCFWLCDCVSSYIDTIPTDEYFVIVRLERAGQGAYFEMIDDLPAKRWFAVQKIPYTDFPLTKIKLYLERVSDEEFCLLLPSEH